MLHAPTWRYQLLVLFSLVIILTFNIPKWALYSWRFDLEHRSSSDYEEIGTGQNNDSEINNTNASSE